MSAEQPSAQDTFERFGDAAREAGVVVVPAMGFYGGLADLLATAAADGWASVDEVRIAVAFDSWHPTVGTRITGYRNTARRLMIADARLAPIPQPAPETSWAFPQPFGPQEVIEAVERILGAPMQGGGAFAPGEIFDAGTFLRALSPQHLTLELETTKPRAHAFVPPRAASHL